MALAWPPELTSREPLLEAILPEDAGAARIEWPCIARARGRYALENVYIETTSVLGFWATRRVSPTFGQVRVYPNVLEERRRLAGLFLNQGNTGLHAQRQVGKGREFEKLREYIPGDSYEEIHWKATAKRGKPVTKVFQLERTQEVYVVIDASRLSGRDVGLSATNQLERFLVAALLLGQVAERQGDLFGIAAFDEQVRAFVRARNGRAHYNACREALYTLEPRLVNPDFGEVFSFLRMHLRRRALVIFLTSLDDPLLAEQFVAQLDVLARRHLVLINMLARPGIEPLFSKPHVSSADDVYARLGGHIQWRRLQALEKVLARRGVAMTLLDDERMCAELVSQYINVKRRQAL
ncbi:MAG TPA: DUF58 domain-containing protein [Candidatus Hydrogenedentes bacterium]|nr:DUF58 domain-containing protein [Candidatus Hydrogenedentota bacterium]